MPARPMMRSKARSCWNSLISNHKDKYSESNLEQALIHRTEDFLLELGDGLPPRLHEVRRRGDGLAHLDLNANRRLFIGL
jgi:hypothetical protein